MAEGFWATVELLADASFRGQHFDDEVDDWLENVSNRLRPGLDGADSSGVKKRQLQQDGVEVDFGNIVDCRIDFSHGPVRTRLETLMGSNVVRLTDRKYMLKLVAKIRQDHEKKQETRMKDRAFRELMRTKLLILNRFIPLDEAPPEIHEYPLFQLYQYCDSIMGKPCEKRKPKKVRIPRSLYRLMYPVEICKTPDSADEDEDMLMKEVTVDGVTRMVFMDKEEVEDMKKRKQVEEDVENGYMFPQEEYEKLHYEADDVKELRDAQTISDMYTKANEIIGALYSLSKSDRKKRCEPDKDPGDASVASSSQATTVASSSSKKSVP